LENIRRNSLSESSNMHSYFMKKEDEIEEEIDIFKIYDYPKTKCKQIIEKFLMSFLFQIFVNIFTIWCLFADDFKLFFVKKNPGDFFFDVINVICMFTFICEILLTSLTRKTYFLSFFFFMDLISTFIIIFDLSWVQDSLL